MCSLSEKKYGEYKKIKHQSKHLKKKTLNLSIENYADKNLCILIISQKNIYTLN